MQNIVNSIGWHAVSVVGEAVSAAAFSEGIFQFLRNSVVGIPRRRVVEVAADNHRIAARVNMFS